MGEERKRETGEEEKWRKMVIRVMTEKICASQRGSVSLLHPQWELRPAGCVCIPPSSVMALQWLNIALCGWEGDHCTQLRRHRWAGPRVTNSLRNTADVTHTSVTRCNGSRSTHTEREAQILKSRKRLLLAAVPPDTVSSGLECVCVCGCGCMCAHTWACQICNIGMVVCDKSCWALRPMTWHLCVYLYFWVQLYFTVVVYTD